MHVITGERGRTEGRREGEGKEMTERRRRMIRHRKINAGIPEVVAVFVYLVFLYSASVLGRASKLTGGSEKYIYKKKFLVVFLKTSNSKFMKT